MKSAQMHIAVLEFTCPDCGEHISSPGGSHMFELHEIPEQLKCDCCGKELKVPKRALKLAGKASS